MPLGLTFDAVGRLWSVAAALALGMAHGAEITVIVVRGGLNAEGHVGALGVTPARELDMDARCADPGRMALAALGRTLAADAAIVVPSGVTGGDAGCAVKNEVFLACHAVRLERPNASGAAG